MQMTGYPGEVIHQPFRVFENLVIDPLQSVSVRRVPVFAKQQKGIIHVAVSMNLRRTDATFQLKLSANFVN
jgi:hypothetical protein